eukprot:scaffold34710_cov208-Amphora_coffeaeformis.AAC.5
MTEKDLTEPWDDICLNPHEAFVAQGRDEGRRAGEEAGYREGWQLGQTTALEYGMELGFMRGIIETLPSDLDENSKAAKTLRDLKQTLDKFPEAEAIFQQRQAASATNVETTDMDNDSEQPVEEENVRHLIQRIRARFRLLMVQLKMPNLSLKEILNKSASDSSAQDQTTSDW